MFAERTPERNDLGIAKIASAQFGVFSRGQALEAGFSVSQITRKIASGRWEKIHRSVYALAGSPDSYDRRLMAACLLGGGVASHLAAGRLLGLLDFDGLEVTVARKNRAPEGITFHVSKLEPLERGTLRGIPCTDPTRTIIDLAQVLSEQELERALDIALVRGMTSIPRLNWRLRVLGKRQGAARLRRLLDERDPKMAPTESDLEQRIEIWILEAGYPQPVHQHPAGRYFIDLAYPDRMIAIECDGWDQHGRKAVREKDIRKQNFLVREGWDVYRFTWSSTRDEVIESLRSRFPSP